MNMFIDIHDSKSDEDLHVGITTLNKWYPNDFVDRQGNQHFQIVYRLLENRLIEEEFASASERDAKLDELSTFAS